MTWHKVLRQRDCLKEWKNVILEGETFGWHFGYKTVVMKETYGRSVPQNEWGKWIKRKLVWYSQQHQRTLHQVAGSISEDCMKF